jgi:DNA gyrase/topoisomerase IV subunit A
VPIGLINGNTHRGGLKPPFRPQGVIDAIRLVLRKPRVASREMLETIGLPDFMTGCTVTGDMSALYAGQLMELRLESRVTITDEASVPGWARQWTRRRPDAPARNRPVLLIDHFPPYANPDEAAQSLAERSEQRSWDDDYPELRRATRLQLRNVLDLSTSRDGIQIACLPAPDADPDQVRDQVRDVYGVWVGVTVRLRRPLATTIRQWVARNRHEDILGSVAALEQALAARQPNSGR